MSRAAAPTVRRASGPNCGTAAWCAPASAIARLLRLAGLQGCHRRKGPPSPRRAPGPPLAPDLVRRNFAAAAPDRLWVADITYVPTWAGFLYLAVVLDVHSRRVVGWAMADHLRSELVIEAVDMAVWRRRPTAGVIHHSDQGSQYGSLAFGRRLREAGLVGSMGSRGDCFDNATAESFFATLECELLARAPLPHTERRPPRALRLHRGVLQHPPEAFRAGVSVPRRLREEVVRSTRRHLTSYCPPNRGNSTRCCVWVRAGGFGLVHA